MEMYPQRHLSSQYSRVPASVDEDGLFKSEPFQLQNLCDRKQSGSSLVAHVIIVILVGSLGFILGTRVSWDRKLPSQAGDTVPQVPIGQSTQTFSYNQSFAAPPSIKGEAEPIWDSLLPNGLGYVKNPKFAANISVISVFHQLHCLYTLRRAYYSTPSPELEDFDFGIERSPHTAHCFEYLRQSLMCSADSSVEPAEVPAFLGWGFQRHCRDYGALKEWAETWRAFQGHGFLAKDRPHHE